MTDETPENEIDVEKTDEHEEPETEETTEDDASEGSSVTQRPYISYSASARRGTTWNSPIGLAVAGILISKGMDLAYRAFMEREKTVRMQSQQQNQK